MSLLYRGNIICSWHCIKTTSVSVQAYVRDKEYYSFRTWHSEVFLKCINSLNIEILKLFLNIKYRALVHKYPITWENLILFLHLLTGLHNLLWKILYGYKILFHT